MGCPNTHAEPVSCFSVEGRLFVQQGVLGNPPGVCLQVQEHIVLIVVHNGQGFLCILFFQGLLILLDCTQRKEF